MEPCFLGVFANSGKVFFTFAAKLSEIQKILLGENFFNVGNIFPFPPIPVFSSSSEECIGVSECIGVYFRGTLFRLGLDWTGFIDYPIYINQNSIRVRSHRIC